MEWASEHHRDPAVVADGRLLLLDPCRIETKETLLQKPGKLVGAVKSDGQRLQCAGKQGEAVRSGGK